MAKVENSKLPSIYQNQTIKQRNKIIDEYIQILDNKKSIKNLIAQEKDDDKTNFEPKNTFKNKNKINMNKNKSDINIRNGRSNNVIYNNKSYLNNKWIKYTNYINNISLRSKSHKESKINITQNKQNNKSMQLNLINKKSFLVTNSDFINNRNKTINIIKKNKILLHKNKIYNTEKIYSELIKKKDNPYGLDWINKILKKNNTEKIGFSNTIFNGVPKIKLIGKNEINKRELKKKLSKIAQKKREEENKFNKIKNEKAKLNNEDLLDNEYNIPINIFKQINHKENIN